jgi:hypothetical protein
LVNRIRRKPWTKIRNHPWIFQRRTEYITPEYFKEEPGISPPDISLKNRVYDPQIFQRKTGYITPGYFTEEPGISPPNISKKNQVYH